MCSEICHYVTSGSILFHGFHLLFGALVLVIYIHAHFLEWEAFTYSF